MPEAFATAAQYATTTEQNLSPAREAQVTELLAQATARIRSRLPEGYEPDPEVAKSVCIAVVQRAVRPPGLRSKTVGRVAETYDAGSGGIYLTEEELTDLLAGWEEGSSGAYTVSLRDEAYLPAEPRGIPPAVIR